MLKKEKLTYDMRTIAIALLILSAVNILAVTETDIINIMIMEGEKFELKCSTNLQYPVVWHFQQSDGTHEIFFGYKVSMAFRNMFFLTGNQSVGEYNLLIPSADDRYAGNYKCIDDEGLGSELMSIQINVFALTSTTYKSYMAPIALHSLDAENDEAPQEAASSYQNDTQSSSIYIPAAVCGIVLVLVIVVFVAVRKWRSKRESNRNESCPEARPSSNPDSKETPTCVKTSSDSSDSPTTGEKLDVSAMHSLVKKHGESDAEKCNSNVHHPASYQPAPRLRIASDSSTAPLLTDSEERTPEI